MTITDLNSKIAALVSEIAAAELRVSNLYHTLEKLEQGDSWHDGFRLHFGRHAKAARTRFTKAERDLRRLRDRHALLTAPDRLANRFNA